jgi:hypothetical protein
VWLILRTNQPPDPYAHHSYSRSKDDLIQDHSPGGSSRQTVVNGIQHPFLLHGTGHRPGRVELDGKVGYLVKVGDRRGQVGDVSVAEWKMHQVSLKAVCMTAINDSLLSCIERDQVDEVTEPEVSPDSLFIADIDLSDPAWKSQLPRTGEIAEILTGSIRGRLA